jgi:prepilin-type N-terminal cleavage/methylation domain-containing protein
MSGSDCTIQRRGFSLIELLMAIFILGIGLISIASLLPAGIVLQQRAEDELMGPLVASDALDLLRSRLDAGDFGTWWDFYDAQQDYYRDAGDDQTADSLAANTIAKLFNTRESQPAAWLAHDVWPWQRPATVTSVSVSDSDAPAASLGTLDVFNSLAYDELAETVGEHTLPNADPWRRFQFFDPSDTDQTAKGIPFDLFHMSIPRVLITPEERSWPHPDVSARAAKYFWECAFRKVGEEVQVAIFVYRVQRKSLNTPVWTPAAVYADSTGNSDMVPLLRTVNLNDPRFGPWTVGMDGRRDDTQIPGGESGANFEAGNPDFDWQRRGQYLLDQYGTLHRVLGGRDSTESNLTLTASVPAPMVAAQLDRLDLDVDRVYDDPQMFTASTILPASAMGNMSRKVDYPTGLMRSDSLQPAVDRLWYLPSDVQTKDGMTYQLIPVYATVGNL